MSLQSFFDKVFTNWQVKLLSFGLAVLLYVAFQIISLDTKSFSIPLTVQQGGNFVLAENAPSFVRIEVRGESDEVASIQEAYFKAFIDTSSIINSGKSTLNVSLELDESLTLMDTLDIKVSPASVSLEFEESITAWVPVEPRFKGIPLDGYEVVSWTSVPSDVKIVGPKSIVESTTSIIADAVDLHDAEDSFVFEASLETTSKRVHLVGVHEADISIEIVPQIITRVFENIEINTSSLIPSLALSNPLPQVAVDITGDKIPLSMFETNENFVEIDFSEITEIGEYTLPVRVNIPSVFVLNSTSINEITVNIIEAPIEEELGSAEGLIEGIIPPITDFSVLEEELE